MIEKPDPVNIDRVSTLVEWFEKAYWSPETREINLWFRGHTTQVREIKPCFLRGHRPIGSKEIAFNNEFRRRAASVVPNLDDLVEVYILAQHHGLATRLLDWTNNPLAALFFAVSGNRNKDGEVVVAIVNSAFSKREPLLKQAVASLFGESVPPPDPEVFFIVPDLSDPRVAQQGSCFSLHMSNKQAIFEKTLVRLPVPAKTKCAKFAKFAIQESLRMMGVSWATLFPDLDHLCREMQASWGFELAADTKQVEEC